MTERIVVAAIGASTPLGRDAWSSAAAVRAGASGFGNHPFVIDTVGAPVRAAIAPWIDIGLSGADRLEALLFPALEQALAPVLGVDGRTPSVVLALGLPSPRPGMPPSNAQALVEHVRLRYPFAAVATFASGHAAGLVALGAAFAKLHAGSVDACVVASVDSYIEPLTLEWLERCEQLHGAGRLNNAWGFIPGEAGAALLLMLESKSQAMGLTPLALVLGVGSAVEDNLIKTDTVCIGEGLTAALRAALASLPVGAKISDVYADMNGEPYRADEFGFAALRTREHFDSISDYVAPADCWGDVAAAGGVLHVMLATVAGVKGYASGNLALVWASSESGERAAAVVATRHRGP